MIHTLPLPVARSHQLSACEAGIVWFQAQSARTPASIRTSG